MKGRFWRKALAAALALLIVSGSTPIQPFSQVFDRTVIKASAATQTVTKTVTFDMDGGKSGTTTKIDEHTIYTIAGGAMNWSIAEPYINNIVYSYDAQDDDAGRTRLRGDVAKYEGIATFPDIEGKVTKVEFTNMLFSYAGADMYVGKDRTDTSTLLHIAGTTNDYDFPSNNDYDLRSVTFEGNVNVDKDNPLKLFFYGEPQNDMPAEITFVDGSITITYETEEEITEDPGHTFSYTANGNSLTATCNQNDSNHVCGLTNKKAVLTLTANDTPRDPGLQKRYATLNTQEFADATGITDISSTFVYENKDTHEKTSNGVVLIGDYTVTATIIINGDTEHPYTLTKDFTIFDGELKSNYPQFSFSPKIASPGEPVTIFFNPLAGESVNSLTLTGEKTNYSIGNGITDNGDGTYTFTMVSESVTLGATLSEPDASHFEQNGDTYIIKSNEGWNWFCFALNSGLAPDGFSGKTVKLATDVESSEMAGTSNHPFKGTFDGQGKTLTFNLTASEGNSAPFHYTDDATISNLHVTGLIEGGDISSLAGLVGKATGNITIETCHVSTQISTTVSISAWHGGIIAFWDDSNVECTITGCVYDGLIYNPNEANVTSYCFGFIGNSYGSNMNATFTDCLFAPAEYTNDKKALREDYGSRTFVYPKSGLTFHVTNCYYTRNLGNRQGRPAATAITAPANLGAETTDHGIVKGYQNGLLFNGNYYTPKYGDAVVEYPFDDWDEGASVTFNGDGYNLVGVNITEEVGNVKSVTYNRTFPEEIAAIVILPFDYICSGSEGGTFYTFAGVNGNQPIMEDSNKLTSLTANTPYLFMPSGNKLSFPNIANMTDGSVTLQPTAGEHTIKLDAWTLTGAYEPKSFTMNDSNIMVLNDVGELVAVTDALNDPNGEYVVVTDATKVRSTSGYFVRDSSVFAITVNSGAGGTITADSLYAKENAKVTLTVTPNAGYVLKSLTVKDSSNNPITVTNNQFTMPATNVMVTAEFIKYTLVSANEPTYTSAGNIEYYTGSDGKYYVLENGEYIETTLEAVTLAQLTLTHVTAADPTCTANGNIEYWYDEANNKYFSDANGENEITQADTVKAATNHDWNAPTYSWTAVDGGYKCTATRTCKNNASHEETEEATVTYAEITAPTAGAKGSGRYTATFTNSAFAVQTKDVEIEMLTPEYADATYTWADDNSSVTAEKKCLNGGADITETVNTTSQITKPATCKAMGETTYYAVFTNGAFAKQEKTVANIATTDHSYTENSPIWSWVKNGDSYDVSVKFKCSICGDIEECDEEPELSYVDEDGYRTYTASVEFEGDTYTMSQRVKLSYNVTVNGVTTQYAYDEIAEAKITTIDEGKFFDGWYEGDKKVSSLMTYTFTVRNDVTLEARFVDSAVQAEPILNFSVSEREVLANGKNKVSFTVEWELPDDCTLVQAAIIRSYTNTDPKYNSSDATVKVSTLRDLSGSYKYNLTLGTASASKTIYARGYIIYLDKNGTSHQMYTDVIVSNSIS